jgi:EmrB/QacA subfamily drug resistance transporter
MNLSSPSKASTLVIAALAVFMTALDTLVVTTALPVLRVALHSGLSGLEWTVNAYNLSFACLLLTGAALGDRFGRRRMFRIGLLVFTAGSAAAALSPSVEALVAARALQGAGAAIVTPLTLTLISEAFPADKRGAAIGLWGGIIGLAVAAGPVVGGAVVSGIDWHWIFWVNVPIGIALIPTAGRGLSESYGPRPQLDLRGLILAAGGALGITGGVVRANASGWTSVEVLGSLIAGAVLIGAFAAWERRAEHPMVPPALFRARGFAAANGVSFFMYAGLFGALFLMSQLLQTALGYSPLQTGLRLLPWTLPPMVIAPLAGALADRYGNRPFMVLGLAMQAIGLAWVAAIVAPGVDYLQLGAAFTVAGVGTSFCFPTVANAIMASVPMQEAGVASGTNSALRELGGVLGVALLASVFSGAGAYATPTAFIHGFTPAVWVAVALSACGVLAARFTAPRTAHAIALEPDVAAAV